MSKNIAESAKPAEPSCKMQQIKKATKSLIILARVILRIFTDIFLLISAIFFSPFFCYCLLVVFPWHVFSLMARIQVWTVSRRTYFLSKCSLLVGQMRKTQAEILFEHKCCLWCGAKAVIKWLWGKIFMFAMLFLLTICVCALWLENAFL